MSRNGPGQGHGHSCMCRPYVNARLAAVGSGFTSDTISPTPVGANVPAAGQPHLAYINQANADLQSWKNDVVFQQSWRGFDQSAHIRATFMQGTPPAAHPYPTELRFDLPNSPAPPAQQQANVTGPSTGSAMGLGEGSRASNANVAPVTTSTNQSRHNATEGRAQVRNDPTFRISDQNGPTLLSRDTIRRTSYHVRASRRHLQSGAEPSRPPRRAARRLRTPSESSDDDEAQD